MIMCQLNFIIGCLRYTALLHNSAWPAIGTTQHIAFLISAWQAAMNAALSLTALFGGLQSTSKINIKKLTASYFNNLVKSYDQNNWVLLPATPANLYEMFSNCKEDKTKRIFSLDQLLIGVQFVVWIILPKTSVMKCQNKCTINIHQFSS